MSNLFPVAVNLFFAGVILAMIAATAVLIRPVPAPGHEPLGMSGALALSSGGLALVLFAAAAVGWIGAGKSWSGPAWWLVPSLVWFGIAAGVAFLSGRRPTKMLRSPALSWASVPALLFLSWVIAFDLLMCFNPVFHDDARLYHLTLPWFWVQGGGLKPHPTIVEAGYPLLTEMIYAIPVTHGLPFATRIIHLGFGLGVVLVIYSYLRDRLSAAGALTFGACFFLFDSINEIAAWSNTDLARAMFLVGAAAFVARYLDRDERRYLVVGSILAGLALSTHYMCIVFGNGLLSVAFVAAARRSGFGARRMLRDVLLFWAISLVVFSPWLLKNLVHYGRPLYGIRNTSFRIPTPQVLGDFYFGNVFFVGFLMAAAWIVARRKGPCGDRFLALYMILYLFAGIFEIPNILRFFFPVYAIGLIMIGRLATPLFERRRRLGVVIPTILFLLAVAITVGQWRNHLYADSINFIFRGRPAYNMVTWHR